MIFFPWLGSASSSRDATKDRCLERLVLVSKSWLGHVRLLKIPALAVEELAC